MSWMRSFYENFQALGFTPFGALKSATADAARLLRRQDDFGTIAPGRRADPQERHPPWYAVRRSGFRNFSRPDRSSGVALRRPNA